MIELTGLTAVVTGGGNGMGRSICKAYAAAGAQVVVADIRLTAAQAVTDEICAAGGKAIAAQADVSKKSQVEALMKTAYDTFGAIDVLCNNAGIIVKKLVEEMDETDWDMTMNVNAKGVFLCSQAVLPYMKRQGGGRIISTASVSGKVGFEQESAYCASKAAVILYTRALALETAKDNILVNCVCPGNVETDMMRIQLQWEYERTGTPIEDLKKAWTDIVPLGRLAQPEDIANMYVFLASPYASYLTGDALHVAGGLVMA